MKTLRLLGLMLLLAAGGAVAYYYFFMRQKKPQVEIYYDDGSMVAFQGSSPEAGPFLDIAQTILAESPVAP